MTGVQLAVLIPVKAFRDAKKRLSELLSPAQRAALARHTAGIVVAAAEDVPVYVVCDDDDVASWAESCDATVLWRPGLGLNPAVTDGVSTLAGKGYDHVIVAHSDLPLARRLPRLARPGIITMVPDRSDDGTNVLALPTAIPFEFAYGAGSFHRHLAEATRLDCAVHIARDPELGRDLDVPADLADPLVQEVLPWLRTNPGNPD